MIEQQMPIAELYRLQPTFAEAGKWLFFCNLTGQRYKLHLVPRQELEVGKKYPVLIEWQNGQLLRKYLLGTELVSVYCAEC
jgi:hypothetical protein